MKATIAGTMSKGDAMRVAAGEREVREVAGWIWADLGDEVRTAEIDALAARIGEVVVIEVELPSGGRGRGLYATRRTLPGGEELDLTGEARETLHDWISNGFGGGFDEEDAALELAWMFAEQEGDAQDDEVEPRPPGPQPRLDTWAGRLYAHLLATKSIELDPEPENVLEGDLATALEAEDDDERLAEVSDTLMSSIDVIDVFIDDTELADAIAKTRAG